MTRWLTSAQALAGEIPAPTSDLEWQQLNHASRQHAQDCLCKLLLISLKEPDVEKR
ncbi:MAG: hypothetical protein ACO1Q7_04005 [Gemmatimonas sp.]